MNYNNGNLLKYQTKNPLKRMMLNYFLQNLIRLVKEQIVEDRDYSLLDAGCGEGMVSNLLYDEVKNLKISAFDCFQQSIDLAQKDNQREIDFFLADIEKLDLKNGQFDLVLATEVLEHLENPQKALKELFRVTAKTVIVSVPNEPFFCLGNLVSGKNVTRWGNPIDHINHWTLWGFRRFLRENLPQNVSIQIFNNFVWTLAVITKNDAV